MPTLTPTAAAELFRQRPRPVPRRRRRRGRLPPGRDRARRAVRPRLAGQRRDVPARCSPTSSTTSRATSSTSRAAGSSRFTADTPLSIDQHITSVRRVVDLLELDDVAVVGHDSGGMIARHAVAGDPRLRAMGLINTEQPHGLSWRFKLVPRRPPRCPGSARASAGSPGGRGCAATRSCSATRSPTRRCSTASSTSSSCGRCTKTPRAATPPIRLLRSFDAARTCATLGEVHRRITVPVQLVWGDQDPFFPLPWAEEMVGTFPDARLDGRPGRRAVLPRGAPGRGRRRAAPRAHRGPDGRGAGAGDEA